MKKRTKISLRTKIYLALVALLSLSGALYAFPANPFNFSLFPQITGLAATKSELFATGYVTNPDIYSLDCAGIPTVYQAAPPGEKYVSIAPAQAANAGFTPRDVFITLGQGIYKATPPGPFTLFTVVPCSGGEVDHSGITFDRVGTFGNDLIFTCQEGDVFKIDNIGNVPHVTFLAHASNAGEIEGPAVAPMSFGTFGGQILVADEGNGEVNAIKNDGPPATVTHNIFNWPGDFEPSPEALTFVPQPQDMCSYCGFSFFQSSQQNPAGAPSVFAYPPSDFNGLGGSLLVTLESNQRIALVQFLAGNYSTTVFDNPPGSNILEGNSFVDCDVPTPTPTSTPTATSTPTSTSTPTATFTPTATATFTPTATATFTPTATATFTPTATATFTPTASATFTPTPTPTPTGSCNPLASCVPVYPTPIPGNTRASIPFNESTVLKAFKTTVIGGCNPTQIQVFYNDEHALTLGVRQIQDKTSGGTTTTNYPITPMTADPDSATNPFVGATEAQGGVDTSGRPMFPAIFVTDVTNNPNSLAGDWQFGGTGQPPNFVSGTWKGAIRLVDHTKNPAAITVTPDNDPPTNNWNLGPGADPVPTPTPANEGYGAEVRWNVDQLHDELGMPLQGGHTYRLYFMVHDGDQNKTGGDSGQGCSFVSIPPFTPTPTPTASPTATATASPITVTNKVFSAKTVVITFQNSTASAQVLSSLYITWPQATNGNLQSVKMGANTISNTSFQGGNANIFTFSGTTAQRTINAGASQTLTFTFQNTVAPNNSGNYTGQATFNPFGPVIFLP